MKALKIIITIVCAITFTQISSAQQFHYFQTSTSIGISSYYDGYWTRWIEYDKWSWVHAKGTFDGFSLYYGGNHPSEYFFKFFISNPSKYTPKEIKEHWKSKEWLKYEGVVEYFVTDDCPTIKDEMKLIQRRLLCWGGIGADYNRREPKAYGGIAAKRTAKATIEIQPYKTNHNFRIYNIYFDDVAIGIYIIREELL